MWMAMFQGERVNAGHRLKLGGGGTEEVDLLRKGRRYEAEAGGRKRGPVRTA